MYKYKWYLNIFAGLCGTFDDDETNDFMMLDGSLVQSDKSFVLSWR